LFIDDPSTRIAWDDLGLYA